MQSKSVRYWVHWGKCWQPIESNAVCSAPNAFVLLQTIHSAVPMERDALFLLREFWYSAHLKSRFPRYHLSLVSIYLIIGYESVHLVFFRWGFIFHHWSEDERRGKLARVDFSMTPWINNTTRAVNCPRKSTPRGLCRMTVDGLSTALCVLLPDWVICRLLYIDIISSPTWKSTQTEN